MPYNIGFLDLLVVVQRRVRALRLHFGRVEEVKTPREVVDDGQKDWSDRLTDGRELWNQVPFVEELFNTEEL